MLVAELHLLLQCGRQCPKARSCAWGSSPAATAAPDVPLLCCKEMSFCCCLLSCAAVWAVVVVVKDTHTEGVVLGFGCLRYALQPPYQADSTVQSTTAQALYKHCLMVVVLQQQLMCLCSMSQSSGGEADGSTTSDKQKSPQQGVPDRSQLQMRQELTVWPRPLLESSDKGSNHDDTEIYNVLLTT